GDVEPQPRNCGSSVDNNCNGTVDSKEPACLCGNLPQGGTQPCTVPSAKGICANGSQQCVPSPDRQAGVLSPCAGPPPQPISGANGLDNNGDGFPDEVQPACGSPCLDPLGSGAAVPAVQRFASNLWGCPGKRNFVARGSACVP